MKKLFIVSIIILLLIPSISNAAGTQLFVSGPNTVSQGSTFTVHLKVSSGTAINTVEAHVSYPTELLQATGTRKGASVLKLWPEEPSINSNAGVVSFTGGLPNPGFTGNSGQLVDITFKALNQGTATIAFTGSSQVLLNDGQGTSASWGSGPLKITITKPAPAPTPTKGGVGAPTDSVGVDTTPPTNLDLLIGRDSYLFNGEWFAVFTAEDSGSGIDHYEIAEINANKKYPENADWHIATSPYKLVRQLDSTKVFLKVVDKAGNMSVITRDHKVVVPSKTRNLSYIVYILVAIIVFLLLANVYQKFGRRKGIKK